jgi:hypothetical protein
MGLEHFNYLLGILKKFHGVKCNMASNKFAGMDVEWNYTAHRCCISIPGYTSTLLLQFKHPHRAKSCLSPHNCLPIAYGAKSHIIPDPDSLDASRKCCMQEIVGSIL